MSYRLLSFIALSAVGAVGALYLYSSLNMMRTEQTASQNPGLFPILMGIVLLFLVVAAAVMTAGPAAKTISEPFRDIDWAKLVTVVALLIGFVTCWVLVGFYVSAFAFSAVTTWLLLGKTKRSLAIALMSAGISTAVFYILFGVVLGLSMEV